MPLNDFSSAKLGNKNLFEIFNRSNSTTLANSRLVCKDWNKCIESTIWPKGFRSLSHVFERVAANNEAQTFLQYQRTIVTYQLANIRANQLAHHLLSLNLPYESRVCVYLPNSPALFLTILAIWKAGLVYVPLPRSDEIPHQRLIYCADECEPAVVITNPGLQSDPIIDHLVRNRQVPVVLADNFVSKGMVNLMGADPLQQNPGIKVAPNQLAYIIYTSGKTGTPKGVMIEHKGLVKSIAANSAMLGVCHTDKMIQQSATSFDAHLMEFGMVFASYAAATLVIMPREQSGRLPIELIGSFCQAEQITMGIFTPSVLDVQNPAEFNSVRAIISTGERLYMNTLKKWAQGRRLINGFGPTEVTIATSLGEYLPTDKAIHVGTAMDGLEVFIDEKNEDDEGELLIAGFGVGRGYLKNEVLTSQSFKWIKHPLRPNEQVLVYKTGDIFKQLPGGNLEYICRNDSQLKIHGKLIRIEETQLALSQFNPDLLVHVDVLQPKTENSYPAIVAYLFTKDNGQNIKKLWEHVTLTLPTSMCPTLWAEIPVQQYASCLNANKKIDSKKIDLLRTKQAFRLRYLTSNTNIYPRDDIECKIALIWRRILKINEDYLLNDAKQLPIDSHFFHLGGTSIQFVVMVQQVATEFLQTDLNILMTAFLHNPTLNGLARIIRSRLEKAAGKYHAAAVLLTSDTVESNDKKVPLWMPASLMGDPQVDYRQFVNQYADKKRKIYGLRARGLISQLNATDSMTELALANLAEVYAIQKQEPYIFCGWSGGGLVAAEMTRLAQKDGKLAHAIMIDSEAPSHLNARKKDKFAEKYFFRLLSDSYVQQMLVEVVNNATINHIKQSLHGAIQNPNISNQDLVNLFFQELTFLTLKKNKDNARALCFIEHLRCFFIAALAFDNEVNVKNITLIAADKSVKEIGENLGWPKDLNVIPVAGNHFSIMIAETLPINYAEDVIDVILRDANEELFVTHNANIPRMVDVVGRPVVPYNLPDPNPDYVVRATALEGLSNIDTSPGAKNKHIIVGMPGVGKTQVTLAYAHDIKKKRIFSYIIWLHLECDADLDDEFKALAKFLDITSTSNQADLVKKVWSKLRNEKVLLIVDNLNEIDLLSPFLKAETNCLLLQIIVTSMNQHVGRQFTRIDLGVFNEVEAIKYMEKLFASKQHLYDEPSARHLHSIECTNGHPLTIIQASTFAYELDQPLKVIAANYSIRKAQILKQPPFAGDFHSNTVYITMEMILASLRKISSMAVEVLECMSFLNASFVPKRLLSRAFGYGNEMHELSQLLAILRRYSLINLETSGNFVSIHSTVRDCLQLMLSDDARKCHIERLVKSFIACYQSTEGAASVYQSELYRHTINFIKTHLLKNAVYFDAEAYVLLYYSLTLYMLNVGRIELDFAQMIIEKAITIRQTSAITLTIPSYFTLTVTLGRVYTSVFNLAQAKEVFKRALAMTDITAYERELANYYLGKAFSRNEETAQALVQFALAPSIPEAEADSGLIKYCSIRYAEAIVHYDKALALQSSQAGLPRLVKANMLLHYASILPGYGRYKDTVRFLDEALTIFHEEIGHFNHPGAFLAHVYYSFSYHHQGKHALAMEKAQVAKAIQANLTELNGDEHFDGSEDFEHNLAHLYIGLGLYQEAKTIITKLAKDQSNVNRNPNFLNCWGHLAVALGDYEMAATHYTKARELRLRMSRGNKNNAEYVSQGIRIARLKVLANDIAGAEKELAVVRADFANLTEQFQTENIFSSLYLFEALLLIEKQQGDQALVLLQKDLPLERNIYDGEDNYYYSLVSFLIEKANFCSSKPDFEKIRVKTLEIQKQLYQILGVNNHPQLAETYQLVANCHLRLNQLVEARQMQTHAVEMLKRIFKPALVARSAKVEAAQRLLEVIIEQDRSENNMTNT